MHHGEYSTASYMVWLQQRQNEHQGWSWSAVATTKLHFKSRNGPEPEHPGSQIIIQSDSCTLPNVLGRMLPKVHWSARFGLVGLAYVRLRLVRFGLVHGAPLSVHIWQRAPDAWGYWFAPPGHETVTQAAIWTTSDKWYGPVAGSLKSNVPQYTSHEWCVPL